MKRKTFNTLRFALVVLVISIIFLTAFIYLSNNDDKKCDYNSQNKKYYGRSDRECSIIKFNCGPNKEYFSDECGCGCTVKNISQQAKNYCNTTEKNGMCLAIYNPVCGWFNNTIQCVRYPCAQTFSNSCYACNDNKVEYWTEGSCPN